MEVMFLVAILLHFGPTFQSVIYTCANIPEGLCGRGQYYIAEDDRIDPDIYCMPCPAGTFQSQGPHSCRTCNNHTKPEDNEVIITHGTSTLDNIISCIEGFFRAKNSAPGVKGECRKCSVCLEGSWAARVCNGEQDTFCCEIGMTAVPIHQTGRFQCVRTQPVEPVRKVRSSDNSTQPTASLNVETESVATRHGHTSGHDSHSGPEHDYSRADYETEHKRNFVEFPVWARILCAGIAIGVFLFYLGVGIPCNACGSRDKLVALRNWAFERHVPAPGEEEEPREKFTVKPTTVSEQV